MNRKELYILAIEAEIKSQKLYQALANSFTKPENSAVFHQLIVLEKNHEDKVREAMSCEFPDAKIKQDIRIDADFAQLDLTDPLAVLEYAMGREEISHTNYQQLAAGTTDPVIKEMLIQFANEELQHKDVIEDLLQSLQGGMTWYDPSELTGFMED